MSSQAPPTGGGRITVWNPEDADAWSSSHSKVAWRNLALSVPSLLCAFSVWTYWSVITVQMKALGFPLTQPQYYTLLSVAGLTGAMLRIPHSFLLALTGGRNVVAISTGLLLLPALGAGIALRDPTTPYWMFVVLAGLSGFGGGAFASSMANISGFFPKKDQGLALGLNAGIGNLGVSIMQVLLPFAMSVAMFGALGGAAGVTKAGKHIWLQNAGLVWVPMLIILTIAATMKMDNLPQHNAPSMGVALVRVLWLSGLAFAATGLGLYLLIGFKLSMWLVLPLTVALTVALMRYASPKAVQERLAQQFTIFKHKHNWVMTWLYTMTFGSFIGFSVAFPKLIQDLFVILPDNSVNPNGPNPLSYAWLGALVGSLIRPVGGWLSDKWGGARVTHWSTVVMIGASLGVAWYAKQAQSSMTPEVYFTPFLLLFLVLFMATGIGNGSTFQMIPIIFPASQAGAVLGWTSAVGACGAFIIPKVFGEQIEKGTPEWALYGFAVYYISCLAVNWFYYHRKGAEIPC